MNAISISFHGFFTPFDVKSYGCIRFPFPETSCTKEVRESKEKERGGNTVDKIMEISDFRSIQKCQKYWKIFFAEFRHVQKPLADWDAKKSQSKKVD